MKINDLVTIDENHYIIFSKCKYNNTEFYYLINDKEKKYCFFENKKAILIEDKNLMDILTPLFIDTFKLHFDIT